MAIDQVLADAVLALHVAVVVFVVGGLIVILFGNALRWRWVNGPWFRLAHLGAIGFVVLESWFGIVCPLTTLEMVLRGRAQGARYDGGFVEHGLQRLLYFDAPEWVFTVAYSVFGAVVAATWWWFPPRRAQSLPRWGRVREGASAASDSLGSRTIAHPRRSSPRGKGAMSPPLQGEGQGGDGSGLGTKLLNPSPSQPPL